MSLSKMKGLIYILFLQTRCTTIWLDASPTPELEAHFLVENPSPELEAHSDVESPPPELDVHQSESISNNLGHDKSLEKLKEIKKKQLKSFVHNCVEIFRTKYNNEKSEDNCWWRDFDQCDTEDCVWRGNFPPTPPIYP
tara:strand:+ start:131 stop:547 length:417 start_codon:yes stop_codon:yes gene_type:complete